MLRDPLRISTCRKILPSQYFIVHPFPSCICSGSSSPYKGRLPNSAGSTALGGGGAGAGARRLDLSNFLCRRFLYSFSCMLSFGALHSHLVSTRSQLSNSKCSTHMRRWVRIRTLNFVIAHAHGKLQGQFRSVQ